MGPRSPGAIGSLHKTVPVEPPGGGMPIGGGIVHVGDPRGDGPIATGAMVSLLEQAPKLGGTVRMPRQSGVKSGVKSRFPDGSCDFPQWNPAVVGVRPGFGASRV